MPVNTKTANAQAWHLIDADAALQELGVDAVKGLTGQEATARLARYGANEIEHLRRSPLWLLLLNQFRDFMVVVLIVAAAVSGVVGEPIDAIAILAIVVINAVIGCIQQYRAERAMEALDRLTTPVARVMRDGQTSTIDTRNIVPGDIVLLEAGDVVAADMRLVEARGLAADESIVTGESVPVEKSTDPLSDPESPVGDRINMALRGTLITAGRAVGLVTATGMRSEIGRIAAMLQGAGVLRTPLQRRLARFGRRLALVILAICAVIFASGVLRGEPVLLMLLTAVSLAVAAIPEALPAVVTASLAFGARNMARRRALVRRLPAVETLGSVTYICADKTGTLTCNEMSLECARVADQTRSELPRPDEADTAWTLLATAMALNNDATADVEGIFSGDPTEVALLHGVAQAGYDSVRLTADLPRVAELPFEAERKRMTTFHTSSDGVVAFTKGAPEAVVALCEDAEQNESRLAAAQEMAANGCRVLAFARRGFAELPTELAADKVERDLEFLGLVGLLDPPRDGVADAVAECRRAGIVPVMITGDHPATALNIARRVGIADEADSVMSGAELARLSPRELEDRVSELRVYARVGPEQKIDIVQALQARGEFVAMSGDGVNDAPALKRADIGVAMGLKGTDVAREAADMVLLDDNFTTIVSAVREGRRIYDNIRKFVRYTMTSNTGELWALFLPPFLGLPIALLPIHILWINLVTDGLPGLAMAAEPEERNIMKRPPRPPGETLFARGNWQRMIWVGLLIGGLSILAEHQAYRAGMANWQTIVFTVLTFAQLANALVIRSETESLLQLGLLTNKPMLLAVLLTIVLQLCVIYLPGLQAIFKTHALSPVELAACLVPAVVVLVAVELDKWWVRLRSDTYSMPGRERGNLTTAGGG